jgi:KaiC/GvpD/RAD55 family RecA-like ATPase
MVRFTDKGIFVDTEEERQEFYKQMDAGNPIILLHLELYRHELKQLEVIDGS